MFRYLETLGLLSDLHDMLPPQLPLSPLVVLQLVGELCLVLGADQLGSRLLDGAQVPELQLLHGLMVSEQHGVLQVLLRLSFVQFLKQKKEKLMSDSTEGKLSLLMCNNVPLWPDPAPRYAWQ